MDVLRQNFGREAVIKAMNFCVNYAWDHRGGFAFTEDWKTLLEQAIPGVGFADFVEDYIKGNAAVDSFGSSGGKEGKAKQ